jgi:hypothetical protein
MGSVIFAKGVLQYPCHRKAAYDMKWENPMNRAFDDIFPDTGSEKIKKRKKAVPVTQQIVTGQIVTACYISSQILPKICSGGYPSISDN